LSQFDVLDLILGGDHGAQRFRAAVKQGSILVGSISVCYPVYNAMLSISEIRLKGARPYAMKMVLHLKYSILKVKSEKDK
jgi:hypothetical protein